MRSQSSRVCKQWMWWRRDEVADLGTLVSATYMYKRHRSPNPALGRGMNSGRIVAILVGRKGPGAVHTNSSERL